MGSPILSRASTGNSSRKGGWRRATSSRQGLQNYRTKPCKFYLEGMCPRGDDCSYIHGPQPILFLGHPYPNTLYHTPESSNASPILEHAILHHPSYMPHSALPATSTSPFTVPSFVEGRERQKRSRRERTCHYRTKPCRFYQDTGRCAKGDRCNFIHDMGPSSVAAETETESSTAGQDSASEAETAGSEQHEWPSQHEGHPRDNGKSGRGNYYPITWRVIGGGVMMSGSREICQDYIAGRCHEGIDCKFSHPAAADELEPVVISELPSRRFQGSSMSPASSVQFMPVPFFVQAPPRRYTRRTGTRAQDGHAARRKEEFALSGATLQPMEPSRTVDMGVNPPAGAPVSPVQFAIRPSELLEARMIERPLSTPPSASAAHKLLRAFPAESPQ